jgi:hypothetical protein
MHRYTLQPRTGIARRGKRSEFNEWNKVGWKIYGTFVSSPMETLRDLLKKGVNKKT